ncbi:MAG: hypothetical protein HQ574_03745, partial [Chloroflexi bacterium]|nr:hypothetical protein [Chloroflexota bacterium]
MLLIVLGWFSVALANNLRSPQSVRFVAFPIQVDSIANYSVDPAGIEIPVIELGIIAELSSPETFAAVQADLLEPVPVEPELLDILPSVTLSLTARNTSISEPGGLVVYTLLLTNQTSENITLDPLVDDQFGNLNKKGCADSAGVAGFGTYTCSFSGLIDGNAGDTITNTVTATGEDDDDNVYSAQSHSSVDITDSIPSLQVNGSAESLSVNEPGGLVNISVKITNTSDEAVALVDIKDTTTGNLDGKGDCNSQENPYPTNLEIGAVYNCIFSAAVSGNAGDQYSNLLTASIQDDEINLVFGSESVTVSIIDVSPSLNVSKSASKDEMAEPSGSVSFTVDVKNTSVELVILTKLIDDQFGSLIGKGNCSIGETIQEGATYTCSFTETITGNAGEIHYSTVTATITDDEGNSSVDSASVGVHIINVNPSVDLTNSASSDIINEPGGILSYIIQVTNTSVEKVAVLSLIDDQIGNLAGVGTCGTLVNPYPTNLPSGNTYQCQFPVTINGDVGDTYNNSVSVSIQDDEGNSVSDSDDALVSITDVLPSITTSIQAAAVSVDEPGDYVTYTVQVENTSPETVTLTSLNDTQ